MLSSRKAAVVGKYILSMYPSASEQCVGPPSPTLVIKSMNNVMKTFIRLIILYTVTVLQ